ncbi:unnamed protein product [Rangifer tarandus platyrhynchus]|uniref:Uncharacterized protein n=2 Tax=Rangifer tarandus platyrhynchus TaxID=3082113 RepID=A0AC59ZVN2_RANTA|nr:unnamed protein product [Rangifer tarandus platyrhynchus]
MGKRPTASLPSHSVGNLEQGALKAAAVSHLSLFTAVPPTLASEYGEGYGFFLLTGSQGLRHPSLDPLCPLPFALCPWKGVLEVPSHLYATVCLAQLRGVGTR